MPPEPLPWDRKDDFVRERKHERAEAFGSAASRWRNSSSTSYSSHYASRDFPRWGSPDFRRPGHGRQGGWHPFEEKSGHGCAPSRSCERMFGDETYRPSVSRGDVRYGRSSRDGRGPFTQRDWKSSWEMNNGSGNAPGRAHDMHVGHRSADSMPTCPNSSSGLANTWDQAQSKAQNDSKECDNNRLNSGRRSERENSLGSLDWKPLKWNRSGSLSSRGSGFSHSSSSRSLGAVESNEPKHENPRKNTAPVQPASGNAPCVTSAPPSEETTSKKKPRLGWGEGLAKYEKKKVEGPDLNANKGSVASANSSEAMHSMSSNLVDKSPKITSALNGASPTTPSSIVWSSSPGAEDNSSGKAPLLDNGTSNFILPSLGSQNHPEGLPFNLEKLDDISIANLSSSLYEFLQSADPGSLDSSFLRSITMNKLLIWKGNVLKALETTESEIDLLENKLKGLKSESVSLRPCPASSSCSLPVNDAVKLKETEAAFTSISQPDPLKISSRMGEMDNLTAACGANLGENDVHAKGEEPDSPGTATSKLLEPVYFVKSTSDNQEKPMQDSKNMDQVHFVDSGPCSRDIHECVGVDHHMLLNGGIVSPALCDLSLDCKKENDDDLLCNKISALNKDAARQASEVFNSLLPRDGSCVKITGLSNMPGSDDNSLIKQKIAMRRQSLQFKEKILAVKHKIFLNLWREDMQSFSMSKCRSKSQRKFDLGLRAPNGCFQKHRTLARSSFSLPEGILSLVPDGQTFNMTNKLLSESQLKRYRDSLKMPALILEHKDKMISRFISGNGLVEDPCAVEKEKAMINPWTSEEREIFMDKLATCGKDFKKIASFLDHKSTADCVEFYYKNHKSDSFKKMKKHGHCKQAKSTANTYLVASGKRWNREISAASLDILGAVSVMAANRENNTACRSSSSGRILLGKGRDWISPTVDSASKRSSMSAASQPIDDDTCSDDSCEEMVHGGWTDEERYAFVLAFKSHGKDFAKISRIVRTRSQDQCRIFFSKARKCLGLDSVRVSMRVDTSANDDPSGDGSDLEDACILETSSVVSHNKFKVKIVENFPASPSNRNQDLSGQLRPVKLDNDLNRSKEGFGIRVLDKNRVIKIVATDSCEMVDEPETLLVEGESAMDEEDSVTPILPDRQDEGKVSADYVEKQDPPIAAHGVAFPTVASVTPFSSSRIHAEGTKEVSMKELKQEKSFTPETKLTGRSNRNGNIWKFDQDSLMKDQNVKNTHGVGAHSSAVENSAHVPQVSIKLRAPDPLLAKENATAIKLESQDPDPADKNLSKETPPTLNLEKDKRAQELLRKSDHRQQVLTRPLGNRSDSFKIFNDCHLQIPIKKDTDATDSIRGQHSEENNSLRSDSWNANQHLAQRFYLRKCSTPNGLTTENSAFSLREQNSGHPRTHTRSLSDTEKTSRSGDVKLFGKILTTHEKEDKGTGHLRQNGKSSSSTLNFIGHQHVDETQSIAKHDRNQIGVENVPISYGFWDGNRIQTGFSSLPDSTILLAKYPAAFANFSSSSSKMEQQSAQSSIKSNEHNRNGGLIYPPRAQPFTLGRGDIMLSEMRRQNGLEAMSLQQQVGGIVGVNVNGTGGVLLGGVCPAVSDPVAAIKMHYAKTEQYGGQNGNIGIEEETWSGKREAER